VDIGRRIAWKSYRLSIQASRRIPDSRLNWMREQPSNEKGTDNSGSDQYREKNKESFHLSS